MSERTPARAPSIPGAAVLSVIYSVYRRICIVLNEESALRFSYAIALLFTKAMRRIRFANYHTFYGTSGDDRIHADLERRVLQHQARHDCEMARDVAHKAAFEKSYVLRGTEHLDAALKQGRGVLLIGAHLGNFYAYHAALALHGYQITNISEAIGIASMERQIDRGRKLYGVKTVFLERGAARAAMKVLKAGQIFSVVFEVTLRREHAVKLPFGHGLIELDLGPALLAVRLGVPVLAVNAINRRAFHPEIEVLPPFPEPSGETEHERAMNLLALWRDWLQNEILKRPDQWWAWSYLRLFPNTSKS